MDTVISLVKRTKTDQLDEYGDHIYEETLTDVFAEKTSVGFTEFYNAMTDGYKPEIRFILYDLFAYKKEDEVIHDGIRYKVLRTFENGDSLELVCYGGVRVANT